MILLAGSNPALLEGLADALNRSRLPVVVAATIDDADELLRRHNCAVAVVERTLLHGGGSLGFLQVARSIGCTLVTFREDSGEAARLQALPPEGARIVMADLELPLERTRLVALVEYVSSRARAVARPEGQNRPGTSAP